MWRVKTSPWVLMGRETLLGRKTKAICVIMWRGICLHFIHAWRLCLKLNLEEIQDHKTCRLWCRHCWLFLDLQWDDKNRGEGCVKPSNLSRRELYVKSRVRNLLAKEICDIRKKPNILHKGSRKAAFRASWGWQDASYGTKEYKSMNALKKTFLCEGRAILAHCPHRATLEDPFQCSEKPRCAGYCSCGLRSPGYCLTSLRTLVPRVL